MLTNVILEKAQELILDQVRAVKSEEVSLGEAYGRVLAEDITAPMAHPPFARSPLDGFAYRAEAMNQAPLRLKVVSEIPAGTWPEREINTGEAAKILTGAPIPIGANCVVRAEDTEKDGEEVIIQYPVLPGSNIVPQGDEFKPGDFLLKKGKKLSPPAVGLLAAMGFSSVKVYRRPRVGLFSTGSELLEAGQPLVPGKIYNSNSYTLRGLIEEAGCEVVHLPFVTDRLPETIQALRSLENVEAVITTGGASAGDYDLMPRALQDYGCSLLFWKLKMKPGTPACVGLKDNRLYFALSGNPAAAMVTFELLARPALRKYSGLTKWENKKILVKLAGDFSKGGKQRRFLRAKALIQDGKLWADPGAPQGSGILKSMIGSQLLIDVPAGHGEVHLGDELEAHWIGEWEE